MPPITAAIKPEMVNRLPVSNCSVVVGAIVTPAIAAISVASPKLSKVIRGTFMPISFAASEFSAQALKPRPKARFGDKKPKSEDANQRGAEYPKRLRRHSYGPS